MTLNISLRTAETQVASLAGQLKAAQPYRSLESIQSDLEDARTALAYEETLQQARVVLKERIEAKMTVLADHVPIELGKKVTHHLVRLSRDSLCGVEVNHALNMTGFREKGETPTWQAHQLSYGEQHQAALAMKIAVASALADTTGHVFVILDDSLVTFDPQRRLAGERCLLDLVAEGKPQVVLLTCHTDWAADFKGRHSERVDHIDLPACAEYYGATVSAPA